VLVSVAAARPAGTTMRREKLTMALWTVNWQTHTREWSWVERCQLGELIERALRSYQDGRKQR